MKNNQGFTLLISIIVTSMLLIISFVVTNVALKQLVIANSNQESQHAFYNADSGVDCAVYWDFKNGVTAFSPTSPSPINCNGQSVTPTVVGASTATTTFTLDFTLTSGKGCVVVNVGKYNGGLTIIDSKGYNTCSVGAIRRLERGQTLAYYGISNGSFTYDPSATLTNGLVSYWKLDESSGARLDSMGVNNLSNNGGVTQVTGKVGDASNFVPASSQYLSIPSNSSLSVGGTSFTIASWVNISGFSSGQQVIAGKRDTLAIREWILSYLDSTSAPFFRIFDTNGNTISTVTGPAISGGSWHFIVAWLDISSSEINIQVDNGSVTTVSGISSFPVNTSASFGIGAMSIPTEPTGPNTFLNGSVDEVGFWKRVLTSQERTNLYNSGNGNTYNP